MAKKKKDEAVEAETEAAGGSFMDVLMKVKPVKKKKAKKQEGEDIDEDEEEDESPSAGMAPVPASQLISRLRGIQIPWLSLQWVIGGIDIWPLHRFYGSAGAFGAGKSSLGYEIARWFLEAGGVVVIVDTERRVSTQMICNFVGEKYLDNILVVEADSCEQWQAAINDIFTKSQKTPNHPPILILLDSLTAVEANSVIEQAKNEGFVPGRKFSEQAAAIASAFRTFVSRMDSNTALMWTNHIKDAINAMIPGSKRKPGGSAQDYHASVDLWITRLGDLRNSHKHNMGMKCQIKTNKSSFGPSRRTLEVEVRWGDPQAEDPMLRRTVWDWDAATVDLIEGEYKPLHLSDILPDLQASSGKYKSSVIADGEWLPRSMFGKALRANVEIYQKLQDRFRIVRVKPEQVVWALNS